MGADEMLSRHRARIWVRQDRQGKNLESLTLIQSIKKATTQKYKELTPEIISSATQWVGFSNGIRNICELAE